MLTKENMYKGIIDSIYTIFPLFKGCDIPELFFSDEEPKTVVYGDLDPGEIEHELDKLNEEYKYGRYARSNIRLIEGPEAKWILLQLMLSDCEFTEEEKRYIEKAKKILAREKVELTISAYFDSDNNKIVVYSKAFDEYDQPKKDAAIRRTIAHEMLHAVQYAISHNTYHENSYYAEVVREALADFYSYILCLDSDASVTDGIDINACEDAAERRYRFWERNIFTYAPYPNAIFCMYRNDQIGIERDSTYSNCIDNGSIDKMKKVFDTAKTSMYLAYLELVPEKFRKPPIKIFSSGTGYSDSNRGFNTAGVRDNGFKEDFATLKGWEIIKKIIADYNIGSLEELQRLIPENIVRFTRGRFVVLESGEILSEYPQWEIVNRKLFIKLAVDFGIITDEEGILYINEYVWTVLKIELESGIKVYSYLFDSDDEEEIHINDTVICTNKDGRTVEGVVKEILILTKEEYRKYCNDIGYEELSKAERKMEFEEVSSTKEYDEPDYDLPDPEDYADLFE